MKYKDNHYDYINIDAVALLTFSMHFYIVNIALAICAFNFLDRNFFFVFNTSRKVNEIESIII